MTDPLFGPKVGLTIAFLLVATVLLTAPRHSSVAAIPAPHALVVPLVDHAALAAHADSAGVPHAGAFALAWMETRTGKCLPNCPRGPGIVRVDSVVDGHVFSHRICREVGRMQINPCSGFEKHNPRCAFQRILHNVEDNYACGLWYYGTLRTRGERLALSKYNGGNPAYANAALSQIGEWWFQGLLTEEDR